MPENKQEHHGFREEDWIGLQGGFRETDAADRVSSLEIESSRKLRVVGNLPHGYEIQPKSIRDAAALVRWLVGWIEAKHND